MLPFDQARAMARAAAPAGYRLQTIAPIPGAARYRTLYVDARWRSRRGEVDAGGASVHRTVYGPKFRRSDGERLAQVTARIRADYKQAQARGIIPAALRLSVRTDPGYGILVDVAGLTDRFLYGERAAGAPYGREAMALLEVLEEIHGAYQRDGSDSFQDCYQLRYSGRVKLLSEAQQADDEKARAARRQPATPGRASR
ncbi:hypothetical protein ACFWXO_43305 [Kitasatospora sp. NPDC059088]|uniref:hypothetical protein n=1 Tax=Kitasatospora sp. NPDC059088 TaxID=3346722 RepID=UPI0036B7A1FD